MNKFDLIVVGMGPGGIFCAYELVKMSKHKNILLIEQGRNIKDRVCPMQTTGKCAKCKPYCNITCGFSGAGAFSDGKLLSYHLSQYNLNRDLYLGGNGSELNKLMKKQDIIDLITYTDDIYLNFGADKTLHGIENVDEIKKLQDKAGKEDLNLIDIPLRHLGTEKAHILYSKIQDFLENNNVKMMFQTHVEDVIIKNNMVEGVVVKNVNNGECEKIYAQNVVLAIGRKGAEWLSNLCDKHKIETVLGNVDIGVRFELPNAIMKKVNDLLYEGKFIGRPLPYGDKVRTFCQNPSGFVSAEVYDDGLTLVNGHSYKDKKSENTNLSILVSHNFNYPFKKPIQYGINIAENMNDLGNGKIIVQRLGDIYRGKRTWEEELAQNRVVPTLKNAVAGDITYALGYRTMTDILQFIRQVDKVINGFANPENLLYAPEIKFYSNKLVVDENFQTNIKNLYSIGDGGGLTTGLMMASATGVQMARNLKNKIK